jgi:hypothetical protein
MKGTACSRWPSYYCGEAFLVTELFGEKEIPILRRRKERETLVTWFSNNFLVCKSKA